MSNTGTLKLFLGGLLVLALLASIGCGGRQKKPAPVEMKPAQRVRLADSLLKGGRVNDALSEIDKAIEMAPDDARLYYHRGRVAFAGGRYELSVAAFERALELDPHFTDAHNFLGATFNELGRKGDAEREFRAALADPAFPTPEKVYFNLGRLYASQNRSDEAIEHLRRAVEIDPKYFAAHFNLASLLDREGKLDEAASEYEVAAIGYRDNGDFHYQLGFVYFRLDQKQRARESLRRSIQVAPGSHSAAKAGDLLKLLE